METEVAAHGSRDLALADRAELLARERLSVSLADQLVERIMAADILSENIELAIRGLLQTETNSAVTATGPGVMGLELHRDCLDPRSAIGAAGRCSRIRWVSSV